MLWNVSIEDSAYYPDIEAETEEQALLIAYQWFYERSPKITVERVGEKNDTLNSHLHFSLIREMLKLVISNNDNKMRL